jgi:peptide/nickel transport system substrate-binding protein
LQRKHPLLKLLVLLLTFTLFAAACGGGDDETTDEGAGETTETTAAEQAEKGGTLVLGAEQEPSCADWIASCAGASWGVWTMQAYTMPRAFEFNYKTGEQTHSNLLADEPQLDEGPPMKVTYKINPKAVWSDGTPITATDFKYTWEQITTGTDIYDKTGYEDIQSVDDSKKDTVVVTFKKPFAAWKDLFGGFYGVYPSHLLQGKDRNATMKDGYKFSGGPWIIDTWTKGQEVKLVPNTKYWGKQPNLDAVVFKFIPDTAAEQQAFKTGQVAMIYPQAQLELAELKTLPNTKFDAITGLNYEAFWFNTEKAPVNSKVVRQALAYATDRNAIVQQLFAPVQPDIKPIQGFITPGNKQWYTDPFKKYTLDLKKVDELMTGDGWAKGADGIWAKGGQKAIIEMSTTAGNKRRELTQQIVQSQWKAAGFDLRFNNTRAATLFGEWGPKGTFMSALFAQVPPSTDPGICTTFCSKNIPSDANENVGNNWTRIKSPQIDEIWQKVDETLDEDERKNLVNRGHAALAEEVPGIPVDPFPDIIIYNTAKLRGPIDHNFVYGPFWNVHEWWCVGGQC